MSLFGGLFSGLVLASTESKLSTGGDPVSIAGDEKSEISKLYQLPVNTNNNAVIQSAKDAGYREWQAFLMAKQSRNDLRSQQALVKILETRLNHSTESMKNEENIQRLLAKHGKAEARFTFNKAETKASFSGYTAELQQAQQSLNFS